MENESMENESELDKLKKFILNLEKRREYQKKHYEKNKEKKIASSKKYYHEKIKPKMLEEQQFIKEMQLKIQNNIGI